ncbi:Serine/threonine-protein kinase, partial [Gonapodya sp. JEL0774]
MVRARAVVLVVQVLASVTTLGTADTGVVREYVGPIVRNLASDRSVVVREVWAKCLGSLGESALRILDLSQSLRPQSLPAQPLQVVDPYDEALREIRDLIAEDATNLLADSDTSVRRAVLAQSARLGVVAGRGWANDVMLGHVVTYLNDGDWKLRVAFFDAVTSLSTYLGKRALSEYILPLISQAIHDAEEVVVERCINALGSMVELGLLGRKEALGMCSMLAPLLCHPSVWIRLAAVGYITTTAKTLPLVDVRCIVYPTIKPFLTFEIPNLSELAMLENLKPPISKALYEVVITWLLRSPRATTTALDRSWGMLGSASRHHRTASSGTAVSELSTTGAAGSSDVDAGMSTNLGASSVTGDKEADLLLVRLRSLGMTDDERERVNMLRPWMSKVVSARAR